MSTLDNPTTPKEEGKKKKGIRWQTVSSVLQVSQDSDNSVCLNPFVRCLVPNTSARRCGTTKLIMHQLHVMVSLKKGIRICRGFPNRIHYADFKLRYWILAQKEINSSKENKTAVYALMIKLSLAEIYRLWTYNGVFRAGALAKLEEIREMTLY